MRKSVILYIGYILFAFSVLLMLVIRRISTMSTPMVTLATTTMRPTATVFAPDLLNMVIVINYLTKANQRSEGEYDHLCRMAQ